MDMFTIAISDPYLYLMNDAERIEYLEGKAEMWQRIGDALAEFSAKLLS